MNNFTRISNDRSEPPTVAAGIAKRDCTVFIAIFDHVHVSVVDLQMVHAPDEPGLVSVRESLQLDVTAACFEKRHQPSINETLRHAS